MPDPERKINCDYNDTINWTEDIRSSLVNAGFTLTENALNEFNPLIGDIPAQENATLKNTKEYILDKLSEIVKIDLGEDISRINNSDYFFQTQLKRMSTLPLMKWEIQLQEIKYKII